MGVMLGITYFVPLLVWCFSAFFDFAFIYFTFYTRCLGVVLGGISVWYFYQIHRTLGNNWSPFLEIRESHELITTGVFRYIRHPMYASLLIGAVSSLFLTANMLVFAVIAMGVGCFIFTRLHDEELLMEKQFGEAYKNYKKNSKRLLPFIW